MAYTPKYIRNMQDIEDLESELDYRIAQQESARRTAEITARVQAYVNDPRNKAALDNDKMVQQIRAIGRPAQPPQAAQAQPGVWTPPAANKSREQLERERPWLRPVQKSTKLVDTEVGGGRLDRG